MSTDRQPECRDGRTDGFARWGPDENLHAASKTSAIRQPGYKDSKRDGFAREVLTKFCMPPQRQAPIDRRAPFDYLDIEMGRGMVFPIEIFKKICMPSRRRASFDILDMEMARGRVFQRSLDQICMPPWRCVVWQPGYWDGKRDHFASWDLHKNLHAAMKLSNIRQPRYWDRKSDSFTSLHGDFMLSWRRTVWLRLDNPIICDENHR